MATAGYAMGGRGMSVGSVLSRAFGVIGAAPLLFFGTSFVLAALPSLLFRLATPLATVRPTFDGESALARALPVFLALSLGWVLFFLAAQAVLFRATAAQLDGRREPFGSYVGAAARSRLPLLGLAILLSLAVWFGLILFVVPGIILAMMWAVAAPALVIEGVGVFGAFGRSRYLTSGSRWRIFGLVLLVYAIYFIASALLGIGSLAAGFAAGRAGTPVAVQPTLWSTAISMVLQTAFVAIWTAIQGALFVELRDAKDGPSGDRLSDIFA